MNYTPNYHLPQWAEDDRILRTDFNQMCANIDAAVAGAAQNNAQTSSQIRDSLLRLERRYLEERWPEFDQTSLYNSGGVLYNPLSSSALAQPRGSLFWSAQYGICAGRGTPLSQTLLRNSCLDCWPGNSAAEPGDSDGSSVYRFTAPQNCVIRGCSLFLNTQFTSTQQNLSFVFALKAEKRSGGSFTEIFQKLFLIERSGTETVRQEIPLELRIPLEKNTEYRLKMEVVSSAARSPVPGRFGFIVDRISEANPTQGYADHSVFVLETPGAASGVHTKSFDTCGPASHGLLMVHYRRDSEEAVLTPTLGGQAMRLLYTVQRTAANGRAYQEAWYACEGSFSGETELRIQLNTGGNSDLSLLRYAAAVI